MMIVVTHADLVQVAGRRPRAAGGRRLQLRPLPARHSPARGPRPRHPGRPSPPVAIPAGSGSRQSGLVTGDYRPATALFLNGVLGGDTLDRRLAVLVPRGTGLDLRRWRRAPGASLRSTAGNAGAPFGTSLVVLWRRPARSVRVDRGRGRCHRALHHRDGALVLRARVGGRGRAHHPAARPGRRTAAGVDGRLLRRPPARGDRRRRRARPAVAAVRRDCLPAAAGLVPPGGVRVAVDLPHALAGLPVLEDSGHPFLAIVASLVVGVAAWRTWLVVSGQFGAWRAALTRRSRPTDQESADSPAATAKPRTAARPALSLAFSVASGIIEPTSMTSRAPAAKPSTAASNRSSVTCEIA